MCRLVQVPSDVAPFMPLLLPALDKVIDELVDAEVCDVAKAARAILLKAFGEGREKPTESETAATSLSSPSLSVELVQKKLADALHQSLVASTLTRNSSFNLGYAENIILQYVAALGAQLVVYGSPPNPNLSGSQGEGVNSDDVWRFAVAMSDTAEWNDCAVPYLLPLRKSYSARLSQSSTASESPESSHDADTSPEEKEKDKEVSAGIAGLNLGMTDNTLAEQLSAAYRHSALGDVPDSQNDSDPNDSNLCNIEFSLAFGQKSLIVVVQKLIFPL